MMRLPFLTGALLALSTVTTAAPAGSPRRVNEIAHGIYIVQLRDNARLGPLQPREEAHNTSARIARQASIDYSVRYEFKDPSLFYGLSVKVPNNESVTAIEKLPQVEKIWPARIFPRPLAPIETISTEALSGLRKRSGNIEVRQNQTTPSGLDYNTPHSMTGVDRVHGRGIKGKGIRIAIIDSGVDWHHPAFGACFGPGCKISFGHDLVGDLYTGTNDPVEDNDPDVQCSQGGHGTHVAGIIGMQVASNAPQFAGLTGVAPEADLGMFRVLGCRGGVAEDVLIRGILLAVESKPDIISISIGGFSEFGTAPDDPYFPLISGLTERGIAVVVAAGNDGESQPFTITSPGNSPKAITAASVENTLFQIFELEDSNGEKMKYGSLYPFPINKELKVLVIGNGDQVAEFGCRAINYDPYLNIEDKDTYVVVAKRGLCSITLIQAVSAAAGFRNLLTYPDKVLLNNPFIEGYATPIPAFDSDGGLLNVGITTSQKLYTEGKKSATYTVKFNSAVPQLTRQAWGGQPNNFSSTGPVYDFTMKPQISAPGGMILSTWPLSGTGFAVASGTSMAAPYISGALALLKSQFPSFTVPELLARLQSTANPMTRATTNDLSPPVQQGAGLVNVFDAIYYKSFVSPGQLELGPTERLASNQPKITIKNPSGSTIQYTLGHTLTPGMARYPHWDLPSNQGYINSIFQRLESLNFGATVSFASGTAISLGPGESREVDISIQPPTGLPDHMLPFYNGFITVSANNRESLVIPYVGAAYNYTAASPIGLDPVGPVFNFPDYPGRGAPQIFYKSQGIGNHVQGPFTQMSLVASWLQPLQYTRYDLVRAETDFVPTYYGFDPQVSVNYTKTAAKTTGTIAGVDVLGTNFIFYGSGPTINLIENFPSPAMWDGQNYQSPLPMPVGGYRLLIQMLKIGGDVKNREDWYTWMSGVIEIMEEIAPF